MYTVSFACFSFELLANSWAKTTFRSFCPPSFEGYAFSFFWFLDVIAIVSLFPDLKWIANPIGIGSINNDFSRSSNFTKAARVVRLVRLVRLVKIYKISYEKYCKSQEEKELRELAEYGVIDVEEVEKFKALNDHRSSKLGEFISALVTYGFD
jgi:hypothetical protein